MITINLLPEEYREVKRPSSALPYISLAIQAGALFLLLTLFFYADYLKARRAYDSVYAEWIQFGPQMRQLKELEKMVEVDMKAEKDFLVTTVLNTDPVTRVLQAVSDHLPPHGWLTELKIERAGGGGKLNMQGIVLSAGAKTGIEQIESFFQEVKARFPKADVTLTTSKVKDPKIAGTSFSTTITWGPIKS